MKPREPFSTGNAIAIASPSGRMSKRARQAALKRLATELFPPGYWQAANRTPQPSPKEKLLTQAARLRQLADAGMSSKKYTREAAKLEAQANQLEGSAN